jgi:phosphate uptake regulator
MRVIETDRSVDTLDVEIDQDSFHLLARYHPTTGDLRFITMVEGKIIRHIAVEH